jgi:hypothetical protein
LPEKLLDTVLDTVLAVPDIQAFARLGYRRFGLREFAARIDNPAFSIRIPPKAARTKWR